MPSLTLIHLVGLPVHLLVQFSMVAFVPLLGVLTITSIASNRVSEN